jgi:hypothetical protein
MIHEIDSHDWPLFCQRLTEQRSGATVKLEVIGSNGLKIEKVANATLHSMVFEATDACSDLIRIRLKNPGEIIHEIIEPILITLQSAGNGSELNLITIEAESGVTLITLHPAIQTQMFEGFKNK